MDIQIRLTAKRALLTTTTTTTTIPPNIHISAIHIYVPLLCVYERNISTFVLERYEWIDGGISLFKDVRDQTQLFY